MNKMKKLCSVLLIIMLMVTFVLPSAGYAAGADLSILENCSVTLLKDGNFKLTDTSVDVNVELDKSLEKCHLSLLPMPAIPPLTRTASIISASGPDLSPPESKL